MLVDHRDTPNSMLSVPIYTVEPCYYKNSWYQKKCLYYQSNLIIMQVNFIDNVSGGTKKTVRNNEVSECIKWFCKMFTVQLYVKLSKERPYILWHKVQEVQGSLQWQRLGLKPVTFRSDVYSANQASYNHTSV